jgi:hypothetical protein
MAETIFAIVVCYHYIAPDDARFGHEKCGVVDRYGYFHSHEECQKMKLRLGMGDNVTRHGDVVGVHP